VAKRISDSIANDLHSWIFEEDVYDWWRHSWNTTVYRYHGFM